MCEYGNENNILQTWFGSDYTRLSNSKDYLENYIISWNNPYTSNDRQFGFYRDTKGAV